MREDFLQYLWKYQLFDKANLKTTDGDQVKIISSGIYSVDAGPDFINAKIEIGDTLWAGNVEIHVNASDWKRHKHHNDKAYDNVILHVVQRSDEEVFRMSGSQIPTLVMHFDKRIHEKYTYLQINNKRIPCEEYLHNAESFFIQNWLDNLMVERLSRKAGSIAVLFEKNTSDLEQTFYELFGRNFGFFSNADPFEQLTRITPFKILMKHSDSLFKIEALLFGQAGLLENEICVDEYYERLRKEYAFQKQKYKLNAMNGHSWKFMRLRPMNFPTVRIAQFATIIQQQKNLFSLLFELKDFEDIQQILRIKASDYWDTHYVFGEESKRKSKTAGSESIKSIVINTIVPFLFFYGKLRNLESHCERALDWMEKLSPERNAILDYWTKIGIKPKNAFDSQALLQLKNEYCTKRRCLDCHIGNRVLSGY